MLDHGQILAHMRQGIYVARANMVTGHSGLVGNALGLGFLVCSRGHLSQLDQDIIAQFSNFSSF